ncbi:hypothetical protein BGZ68_007519 [Mortierella alpina]|nr:hypothetical protein BGZ68_007519 [Mortierella alpina]
MSKRGTENQITKDDYAREDDDENVQLGTFKKASQDELARRPMKSLRRTKSSASSGEESSRKPSPFLAMGPFSTTTFPPPSTAPTSTPSPFAAMGAFSAPSFQPPPTAPTSNAPSFAAMGTFSTPAFRPTSTEPTSKPNPFANITFGAQAPSLFPASTSSHQASEAPEQKTTFAPAATKENDTPASSSAPAPLSTTATPAGNSFGSFTASAPTTTTGNASAFASPFANSFAPASTTATVNASPFASSFASSTAPATTTAAANTSLFASPFSNANKSAPTTATGSTSTFGNTTSPAPANASGNANPFASSTSISPATASGNANPFASASSSAFSKGSFTFNVGSNASTISVPTTGSGALSGDGSQDKVDHEGYERLIRGVNQSFFKKIQKELEHNPTVNLSLIFNQYIDHRHKVRKACLGVDEPNKSRGVTGRNQSEAGPGIRMTSIAGIPVESASAPKMSFGLPIGEAKENPPAKTSFPGFGLPATSTASAATPTASTSAAAPSTPSASLGGTSPFSFGSSSIKGAVDPPKNPTSTAWSFATPGSQTSSNLFPSFAAGPTALSSTTTSSTTTTMASTSATSTSTLFPAIIPGSTSGDAPKPFLFSPKPFEFNPPKPAEAASAPKPFAFQIPSGASSPYSDAGSSTANQADNEKMPDDTKAQLVETREGEEDEETVFEVRAKLYVMTNGEYVDLGVGPFRVNENKETKKRRMIMRTGGTGIIALNSWVIQGMGPQREKNNVTVFAIEGEKPRKFLVRVKEEKSAEELFKELEVAQIKS